MTTVLTLRRRQLGSVKELNDASQKPSIADSSIGVVTFQTGRELTKGFKAGDADQSNSISKELIEGLVEKARTAEDAGNSEAAAAEVSARAANCHLPRSL